MEYLSKEECRKILLNKFNVKFEDGYYKVPLSVATTYNHKRNILVKDSIDYHTQFLYKNTINTERRYCILNSIIETPKCPRCNKPVNFIKMKLGYNIHCSKICADRRYDKPKYVKKYNKEFYTKETCKDLIKLNSIFAETNLGWKKNRIEKLKSDKILIKSLLYYTNFLNYNEFNFIDNHEEILHCFLNNTFPVECLNEGCNNKVRFNTFKKGYYTVCCTNCWGKSGTFKRKREETCLKIYGFKSNWSNKEVRKQIKDTMLKRYGFEYPTQNKNIINKVKQTKKERYGDEYYSNTNKAIITKRNNIDENGLDSYDRATINTKVTKLNNIDENGLNSYDRGVLKHKETSLERYGVDHPFKCKEIQERQHKTMLKNHGVKWSLKSRELRNKMEQTYFNRTGYYNPAQNPDSNASNGYITIKKFKNTNLIYQGSFELNFIELWLEFYNLNSIKNGKRIKYHFNDKEKYYFPDFEIIYPNGKKCIVEIKGTHHWFYESLKNGMLLAKWEATAKFIKENKEYEGYYFILNGELKTKKDIFNFKNY